MLAPGFFRLDVALGHASLDAGHAVEPEQYEPGVPDALQPRRHELDFTLRSAVLRLVIGLPRGWNAEVELPVRETAIRARFIGEDGETLPHFESIHHRTETISGIGDVGLWARTALPGLGPWAFDLRLGVAAPTGDTEPDPFELGARGLPHQHVFFGAGSWSAQASLGARRRLGEWSLTTWLRARAPVDAASTGYRAGASGTLGAQLLRPVSDRWSWIGGLQLDHEEASTWRTSRARNSGRTDLAVSVGASWAADSGWSAQALLLVPENLHARGGQVDLEPVLSLGIAWVFGGS